MTLTEALGWIEQQADARGECDQCHNDEQALWRLPMVLDETGQGAFMYCASCFRGICKRNKKLFGR